MVNKGSAPAYNNLISIWCDGALNYHKTISIWSDGVLNYHKTK